MGRRVRDGSTSSAHKDFATSVFSQAEWAGRVMRANFIHSVARRRRRHGYHSKIDQSSAWKFLWCNIATLVIKVNFCRRHLAHCAWRDKSAACGGCARTRAQGVCTQTPYEDAIILCLACVNSQTLIEISEANKSLGRHFGNRSSTLIFYLTA